MNAVEKLKLNQALKAAIVARDNASSALQKLKLSREVQNLRHKLGLVNTTNGQAQSKTQTENSYPDEDMQDVKNVLGLSESLTRQELAKFVSGWLKTNARGKTITASNGAKIRFNAKQSTKHLTHDGRRGELAAKAITHVIEVFEEGKYQGRELLKKARTDFVAFHAYQKWVEIDGLNVLLEAKAGELADGSLETLPVLVAYSQNIKEKAALSAFRSVEAENGQAGNSRQNGFDDNHNAAYDKVQVSDDTVEPLLTILQIKDGNSGADEADTDDLRFLRQVADMSDEELLDDATGARLADILPKIDGNQALSDAFDAAFKHYDERIVALAETELSDRRGA